MREFIKSQKVTYNLMSFTAFKSLIVFRILTEGPKTLQEIIQAIEDNQYLREKVSEDTIRVYMNSLRKIGCTINRVKGKDKISRYVINSHPFELNLTDDQKKSLLIVYAALVRSMDAKDMIFMDDLFEKIAKYIKDDDVFLDEIRNISLLNGINKELLAKLLNCCDKKQQIVIKYNSPRSGKKDIEIITDKIEVRNEKIYLLGFGLEYNEQGMFQVQRILEIKEIKNTKIELNNSKNITVVYKLEPIIGKLKLEDNEKLIRKRGNSAIIEVSSSSEFLLKQKFLELGPICEILEPVDFRETYIKTLKEMKARYYCE